MLSKMNFLRDRFAFESYIPRMIRPLHLFLIFSIFLCLASTSSAQQYQQTNLVSDITGLAKTTDPNLVNSWGLTSSSTSPWWVSDNGTGVTTLYNGTGQPIPINPPTNFVTIPLPLGQTGTATPTGTVFNGSSDFEVSPGNPARFIFVTEDGTISGWNPVVDQKNAVLKVDQSPSAVYKGVTLGQMGGANFLYVANFRGGTVDVFDAKFSPVSLPSGAFSDPSLPAGFAPFNVQNINGMIFVAFAKQDSKKHDDVAGPGFGFVDVFDTAGNWLMSLKHGRWMNSPWGLTMAPADFGMFSNDILVGNFGSGRIAAFDRVHGNFHGLLRGDHGLPITIDGLWALRFGNDHAAGPSTTLFFTAGIDDENHGLFGTITPLPKQEDTDQGNPGGN